jgi:hypothetical protein
MREEFGVRGALSYATSTLMTFVPPGMLTAVPAVITRRSPGRTMPDSRAAAIDLAHRSSTSVVS